MALTKIFETTLHSKTNCGQWGKKEGNTVGSHIRWISSGTYGYFINGFQCISLHTIFFISRILSHNTLFSLVMMLKTIR